MALLKHFFSDSAFACTKNAFVRWVFRLVAIFCFLSIGVVKVHSQAAKSYDLKAVFLFNFAQFVEWPPQSFSNANSPFVIGIVGEDPFEKILDEVVRDEVVGNRKIVIERFGRENEIGPCHILFINKSNRGQLKEILARQKGKPILTVGETENFCSSGGMIGFISDQNKIRLRINLDEARAAGLSISSKMLKTAEIVETTTPP